MNNIINEYIQSNPNYDTNIIDYPTDKVAVIIEDREISHLKWVIENVKYHTGWDVILYHGNNDVENIDCIKIKLNIDIDLNGYNELLKNIDFWKSFNQEHILVFQSDSFMLRSGIEDYLMYDYVGAPWNWSIDPNFRDHRYKDLSIFKNGGNGGFSLRRKSAMIDILEKYYNDPSEEDSYLNEDMFFSKYIRNFPTLSKRMNFCVETIFFEDPIAIHGINKYLIDDQIIKILEMN